MDFAQCACSGKNLDRFLRPSLLGLLSRGRTHGYDLVQQLYELKMFSEAAPDASGIYKILKLMEEEGLISSCWEFGSTGPAKRSFALTENGVACLRQWMETLEHYRAQIDGLLILLDSKQMPPKSSQVRKRQCR